MPGCGAITTKSSGAEVTPPDSTVTGTAPAAVIRLAGTDAVTWLASSHVVVSALALHFTTASWPKLMPRTTSRNALPPAIATACSNEPISGSAPPIVNGFAFEATPPETTVTWAVPGAVTSEAGPRALTPRAFVNVVGSAAPFHSIASPGANPDPATVSVNPPPPAGAMLGSSS